MLLPLPASSSRSRDFSRLCTPASICQAGIDAGALGNCFLDNKRPFKLERSCFNSFIKCCTVGSVGTFDNNFLTDDSILTTESLISLTDVFTFLSS